MLTEFPIASCLLHDCLRSADLPLDLLTSPARSLDGTSLELPVRSGLLDHRGDPILTESIGQLAVGVRVCQVTVEKKN